MRNTEEQCAWGEWEEDMPAGYTVDPACVYPGSPAEKVITFFRSNAPIPILIDRTKLAVALVLGVITPLVLALSAKVFSLDRRNR